MKPALKQFRAAMSNLRRVLLQVERAAIKLGPQALAGATTDDGEKLEIVAHVVCAFFSIHPSDLFSRRKYRPLNDARMIAVTIARRGLSIQHVLVQRFFRFKDFHSVYYALRIVSDRCQTEKKFRCDFDACLQETKKRLNL